MTDVKSLVAASAGKNCSDKSVLDLYPSLTTPRVVDKWDMPCPPQTHPDISRDHAINEWVLNHLPLTDSQKAEMLAKLVKEQKIKDNGIRLEAKKEKLKKQKREVHNVKVKQRYTIENGKKVPIGSIKEVTK
jgi:hypothetical protein